jgi:hypothetical protein
MEIKYQKANSEWGLTGFFEGYKLVFSATFDPKKTLKRKWEKFFPFFKTKARQNHGSIIKEVDIYELFSPSAKDAWNNAYESAKEGGRKIVGPEDIFLSLLKELSVQNLFARMKVSTHDAEKFLQNYLKINPPDDKKAAQKIPFEAFALAVKLHDHKIGSLMLLGALLNATPEVNILQAIFSNIGLTREKLELLAVWLVNLNFSFPENSWNFKLLYCCRQVGLLEEHFGYFYTFKAIEMAADLSLKRTLIDLQHKEAMRLLVKAGNIARQRKTKIISENFVKAAA